jgi:Tol biopolymer transport system component
MVKGPFYMVASIYWLSFALVGCQLEKTAILSEILSNNSSSSGENLPLLETVDHNESIVFLSKADSPEGELYLLDPTGEITRLTDNRRYENNPAFLRNGKKVAFHGGDSENPLSWEIFVLDLNTGAEIQLTDNQLLDAHPDWSPDGTQIVFGSFRDEQGHPSSTADIYALNLDGSGLIQLTDSLFEDNDPEWSPDGAHIVFKSTRGAQAPAREEIFVMDPDGGNIKRLTTTTGWQSDHDPSWSPDGKTIVFSRYAGNRPWTDIANPASARDHWRDLIPWNVYEVDLNGNMTKLTDETYSAGLPVFSGAGNHLLFLRLNFIIFDEKLVGAEHHLILLDADRNIVNQLDIDNRHTPTLEFFDW